uniref:Uncharacterized protein n=1 Tax=Opuntia streptacantha TaxID=393608 RepID=A0A7C9A5Y4_OPUST
MLFISSWGCSIRKPIAKSLGTRSTLCDKSIWYTSLAECPTARTTASYIKFWLQGGRVPVTSETLTPLIAAPSTSRSSTLVPNLIVTPNPCKCCRKQRSRGTNRSVPR